MAIILGQVSVHEFVALQAAEVCARRADRSHAELYEAILGAPIERHEFTVVMGTSDRVADLIFAGSMPVLDRALSLVPRI